MKQKEFGVKGPEVTIIGQGTWYIDRGDRKSAVAALRRGIELGMTHIDTRVMRRALMMRLTETPEIAPHISGHHRGTMAGRLPATRSSLPATASINDTIWRCTA